MGNCIRDECVKTRQKLNETRDRLEKAERFLNDAMSGLLDLGELLVFLDNGTSHQLKPDEICDQFVVPRSIEK